MTDMTVDHLGQVNGAGDTDALFIKVATGEILAAYKETNVMDALHNSRTIQAGKSAAFPVLGHVGAKFHVAGTQLLGSQTMGKNEMIISIDDLLVSDMFLANIEEAKLHWDYRAPATEAIGQALARSSDMRSMQALILAARSSAFVTSRSGGTTIVEALAKTDGKLLAAAISNGAVAMDEKNVPSMGRSGIFKPAQTHLLSQTKDVVSKDVGGEGSVATGYIGHVDGIMIVKSNNVPQSNITAIAGENNTYGGDFTNVVGALTGKGAIGTVKLMDLVVQKTGEEYAVSHQGTLLVGKYLKGTGILNPEDAVEIATA
jgi:hypothetical protein